jgi:SAM-dependent MidA family methyltransferase
LTIEDIVGERGPMTVAAFMDLALYHPQLGYYARAARRSGRAGDFFTSVDVGPLFGELLEVQIAEMFEILWSKNTEKAENTETKSASASSSSVPSAPSVSSPVLVEAGASDGRLAADIARAAKQRDPALYEALRLHLVEASAEARAAQTATLADVADRVAASSPELPESFEGVLIANELLDALPVHQVVMREDGLREVYVATRSALTSIEGPPSTAALQEYLDALGVQLEPGWRVEINLRAIDWMRDAARRLRRGFIVLIDYGHEARELYSVGHSSGTLTTFAQHRSAGPEQPPMPGRRSLGDGGPSWLRDPGEQDLTSHVDFTSVRAAAEAEGMTTIAFLDQTYFLLGLLPNVRDPQSALRNPQSKTLLLPGGLGSTHKVLILGKGVGTPTLQGCSFKVRVT